MAAVPVPPVIPTTARRHDSDGGPTRRVRGPLPLPALAHPGPTDGLHAERGGQERQDRRSQHRAVDGLASGYPAGRPRACRARHDRCRGRRCAPPRPPWPSAAAAGGATLVPPRYRRPGPPGREPRLRAPGGLSPTGPRPPPPWRWSPPRSRREHGGPTARTGTGWSRCGAGGPSTNRARPRSNSYGPGYRPTWRPAATPAGAGRRQNI